MYMCVCVLQVPQGAAYLDVTGSLLFGGGEQLDKVCVGTCVCLCVCVRWCVHVCVCDTHGTWYALLASTPARALTCNPLRTFCPCPAGCASNGAP